MSVVIIALCFLVAIKLARGPRYIVFDNRYGLAVKACYTYRGVMFYEWRMNRQSFNKSRFYHEYDV